MDMTALFLSRIQFAFTITFHIIFPSFTIGLAAWLAVLEALSFSTGRPVYRLIFDFWLKIFGVAFGMGVVSGIVMAFQFGTNWSVLSKMSGPIQGPQSRAVMVLSVFNRDGGAGNHVFRVLDHGQQQLDAGALRLCHGKRRLRSERLEQDHLQLGGVVAISTHGARVLLNRRLLRRRDRCVVHAAEGISRGGPYHAAHGPWASRSAGAG